MKNTLNDLNNYLFECIERIQDDSLTDEELEKEIKKSDAIKEVAEKIIANGKLALDVKRHLDEYGVGEKVQLPLLENQR